MGAPPALASPAPLREAVAVPLTASGGACDGAPGTGSTAGRPGSFFGSVRGPTAGFVGASSPRREKRRAEVQIAGSQQHLPPPENPEESAHWLPFDEHIVVG